jgi:DNA replication and repair protein RecF
MRLSRLEISGVRNVSSLSIECSPNLNLFVGPNGAGKTAILESIYLLARGRSFRSNSVGTVVQRNASLLRVLACMDDEQRGNVVVKLTRHLSGKSELELGERSERRISEVARLMPIQLMLPDASNVVFGGPEERRRLLDWGTFHVKPLYLDALRDFQRALQQRNASLRSANGQESNLGSEERAWAARLVELAESVDEARRWYLERLMPAIEVQMKALAPELLISASYYPGWPEALALQDSLGESRVRDVKSGVTTYGPHRADLRFDVGQQRAAATLSRGQAKIVASAIRLAQAQLTAELGGRRSIFLIDDIGAELDQVHNEQFFASLERLGCQVFATATVAPLLATAFASFKRKLFHVEQGTCRPTGIEE